MASIGAGLRAAVVEWGGVGEQVYRDDRVPAGTSIPYATFRAWIADVPALVGDAETVLAHRRTAQVDLYLADGEEIDDTANALRTALQGFRWEDAAAEGERYSLAVVGSHSMYDKALPAQHYSFDLRITYVPATA